MLDLYNSKVYNAIFCYIFDTYVSISKNGRARIPPCLFAKDENEEVFIFLNEGVHLLEYAYSLPVFNVLLESLFFKYCNNCSNSFMMNEFVLTKNLIKYLFNDDFISLLHTDALWSDEVNRHNLLNVYPLLSEEDKKRYLDNV